MVPADQFGRFFARQYGMDRLGGLAVEAPVAGPHDRDAEAILVTAPRPC
jgi:hypothetical protein